MSQEKAQKILEVLQSLDGLVGIETCDGHIRVYVDNTESYNAVKDPLKQFLNVDVFCARSKQNVNMTHRYR